MLKSILRPDSQGRLVANYKRIISTFSPFSIRNRDHALWYLLTSPNPHSELSHKKTTVLNALKAEYLILSSIDIEVYDRLSLYEQNKSFDKEQCMKAIQVLIDTVDPAWLEKDNHKLLLTESDEILREYVTYLRWLNGWFKVCFKNHVFKLH